MVIQEEPHRHTELRAQKSSGGVMGIEYVEQDAKKNEHL